MKHRRPRFYALVRYNHGATVVHTFRSAQARDEWVHIRSREAIYTGEYLVTAKGSDDPLIRESYRFSRRHGANFAYQEH